MDGNAANSDDTIRQCSLLKRHYFFLLAKISHLL
jgi:hypothetical protein